MAYHAYVSLLVVFFMLCLALLWHLCWFPLWPSSSSGKAKRSTLHRLLRPRNPDDCPACRLASPPSSGGEPASVHPWREVKSRRGAPKRIDTQGYACPNRQCRYFGNTDVHVHAAFWRWQAWSCRTNPDVSVSSLPYHVQRSTRHAVISSENALATGRRGTLRAGRRAGPFCCRASFRLSTSHDHHLVDSRWGTRTDLARAVLLPSVAPAPPTGRTANEAAQPDAGAVALAGH